MVFSRSLWRQRGPGHTVGSENVYVGFTNYKLRIQETIAQLDFLHDTEALDKQHELEGYDDCLRGYGNNPENVIMTTHVNWLRRRQILPGRQNFFQITKTCSCSGREPQTFWQAIQMYWFVHLAVTNEAESLGLTVRGALTSI